MDKTSPTSVLDMTRNNLMVSSSNARYLGNAEYPFTVIVPRFTLARSTSIWYGPIYRLRRTKQFHHHHHHVMPLARISLTLSRHFSLTFIASGRSSGLQPVSSHSCWMYVRAGRPAFASLSFIASGRSSGLHPVSSHSWSSCFSSAICGGP